MARILIPVDHKWRDLPGTAFLKLVLEKKFGHEVLICRQGHELLFCVNHRPDCVIFPHVYDDAKVEFARKARAMGIRVLLYPTEGIPSARYVDEYFSGKFTDLTNVDFQLCWGERARKIHLDYLTLPAEKLEVVGSSRFDFYRAPLNRVIPDRAGFMTKFGFNPEWKTILWTTNFAKASIYEMNKGHYFRDLQQYKAEKNVFSDVEEVALKDAATRNITADFIRRLCDEGIHFNLLVKPHPMESPDYFREVLGTLPTAHTRSALALGEYIWDVLHHADMVVQRSCTTGIEAWFLGKPVLEMQVNPDDQFYSNEDLKECNDFITGYPAFSAAVRKYLADPSVSREQVAHRDRFIGEWCHQVDGRSTLRLAAFIDAYLERNPTQFRRRLDREFLKYLVKHLLYGSLGIPYYRPLRKLFQSEPEKDHLGRFDKWITTEDVESWNSRLEEAFRGQDWKLYSEEAGVK